MSVECPPDVFKQLSDGCGSSVRPDGPGIKFLCEALGEGLEFTGLTSIYIPDLDDKTFNDWQKFEYWCDDIKRGSMWLLINEEVFYDIEEDSTPKTYFKSKNSVKDMIISVSCDSDSEDTDHVMCVEINSKDETLFLIYEDSLAWGLGYADTVLVVKSLDELTAEAGFYPLKHL